MPTRTQTSKRATAGRFGRPGGKPAQRPGGQRRNATSRRPTMMANRRTQKSGAAKTAEKLGGLLPGMRAQSGRRGSAGGRSKKRTTGGLALLAGAAGFAMKNRAKLTSMMRRKDTSTGT
jgi:hypothetical protein